MRHEVNEMVPATLVSRSAGKVVLRAGTYLFEVAEDALREHKGKFQTTYSVDPSAKVALLPEETRVPPVQAFVPRAVMDYLRLQALRAQEKPAA